MKDIFRIFNSRERWYFIRDILERTRSIRHPKIFVRNITFLRIAENRDRALILQFVEIRKVSSEQERANIYLPIDQSWTLVDVTIGEWISAKNPRIARFPFPLKRLMKIVLFCHFLLPSKPLISCTFILISFYGILCPAFTPLHLYLMINLLKYSNKLSSLFNFLLFLYTCACVICAYKIIISIIN